MIFNRKVLSLVSATAIAFGMVTPAANAIALVPTISIPALTGAGVIDGVVTTDTAIPVPITMYGFNSIANMVTTLSLPADGGSLTINTSGLGATIYLRSGMNSWANVQRISITGNAADTSAFLSSKVSWNPPSNGGTFRLTVNTTENINGYWYNSDNGHFYNVISCPGCSWQTAANGAVATALKGLKGYLATVTSREESNFLLGVWSSTIASPWIGGSDETTEGSMKWMTGPEAGTEFFKNGNTVGTQFSFFGLGQPDNFQGTEDCLTYQPASASNRWNDLPCNSTFPGSYLVEYGDNGGTFTGTSVTATRDLKASDNLILGKTTAGTFVAGYVRWSASASVPFAIDATRYNPTSTNLTARISVPDNTGTISVSPTTGLTLAPGSSSFSAQQSITFSGTKADVLAALKSRLSWNAPATVSALTPSVKLAETDSGYVYNFTNGHYYRLVVPGGNPTWVASYNAANASTYKGLQGYLATITSQDESTFTSSNTAQRNTWLGGIDSTSLLNASSNVYKWRSSQQQHWYWFTGPEAGTEFWNNGALNGEYTNFNSDEPNNTGGAEDGIATLGAPFTNGAWNDYPDGNSVDSYLIEYGDTKQQVTTAENTSYSFINGSVADAPTSVTATAKTRTMSNAGVATISWSAPAVDGNRTITGYTVTASPGGATCSTTSTAPTAAATTCDISGLSSLTSYTFTVKATNAFGDSATSTVSSALDVTSLASNPDAPTEVSATAKTRTLGTSGVATVSWTAPVNTGNRTITGYTVTSSPGGKTCSTSSVSPATAATACDVSGLSAFTSYTFTVKADNGSFSSAFSAPSTAVYVTTIAVAPGKPTGVIASTKIGTLTNDGVTNVAWSAPSSNGNRTIIKYTVTANPGGATCETTSVAPLTPVVNCDISGLSAWVNYTFTVIADNGDFVSVASDASSPMTVISTATVPGAPTGVLATVKSTTLTNDGQATISWTEPTDKGTRLEITGYTVTSSPGTKTCSTSSTRPSSADTTCDISGLNAWTNYTFTVKANNGTFNSSASAPTASINLTTAATKPVAPTAVTASVKTSTMTANGVATVSWTAPADKGNRLEITSYTVTSSPGDKVCRTSAIRPNAAATSCAISGLSAWTDYTFTVVANNGTFDSDPSDTSNTLQLTSLPVAPSAPRTVTASIKTRTLTNEGVATVKWVAPSSNGNRTLTKYTVTATPGDATCISVSLAPETPALSCDVNGLSSFTEYTFTVVASNDYFDSVSSAASAAINVTTLSNNPTAPLNVSAGATTRTMARTGVATVTWDAPESNGNRTIVKYIVTSAPGGKTCTTTSVSPVSAAQTCNVSDLSSFTDYTFTVKAENLSGLRSPLSIASAPIDVTTLPIAPNAPSNVQAVTKTTSITNEGEATISWTAPTFNGYRTITGYTVTSAPGGLICSTSSTAPATPATKCDISGLDAFTEYTFTVTATNGYVTSETSAPSSELDITTPAATPRSPIDVLASIKSTTLTNDGVATVSWTAPADTGYRKILLYTVTAAPGGATCTSESVEGEAAATSCDVAGLNALTNYTFTVTAGNGFFNSDSSDASSSIDLTTAPATPDGPTDVTAVMLHGTSINTGTARVSWSAPVNTGNRTITGYTVTSTPGGLTCSVTATAPASAATSCDFSGLLANVSYSFSVVADNGYFSSAAIDSASPLDVTMEPTAPTSPTGIQASVNADNEVKVSWKAPADAGSSTITSYTVTAEPGGEICTVAAPATSCTFTNLTPGVEYAFVVVATNEDPRSSSPSASSVAVDPGVPTDAPSEVTVNQAAVDGDGSVTVRWNPPADAGSSAITSYTVTADPSGATCTVAAPATSCTFTELTPGVDYSFSVVASNGNGNSIAGPDSATVDPGATTVAPASPTGIQAGVDDNGIVTVSWTAPAANGSSPVLSYTVTANPGGATCTVAAPATSCDSWTPELGGLHHEFSVVANSFTGSSAPSDSSVAVNQNISTSNPSAVQNIELSVSGNQEVTVKWDAPYSAGTTDITSYVVTANPGGATCTVAPSVTSCDTWSPALEAGTNYNFTVTAKNSNGNTSVTTSASVDPAKRTQRPNAPSGVLASVDGSGEVSVSWTAPAVLGTPVITSYTVISSPGGATCTVDAPDTSCNSWTPTLEPGIDYSFSVIATNGNQSSEPSAQSVAVDPAVASVAPNAPRNPEAYVGSNGTVVVLWDFPTDDGSSAITGYVVTSEPDGAICLSTGPRTCTFTGLTAGTSYSFTVRARNGNGYSDESSDTAAVDPAKRTVAPSAPSILSAGFGNMSATLKLIAPLSNGGAPLRRYEYTLDAGTTWDTLSAGTNSGTWKIVDLTNGTKYRIQVRAVNPIGVSGGSNARTVIPHTVPGAPTLVGLPAVGSAANASFIAPANNGGETVDRYAYSIDGGRTWVSWGLSAQSPELVRGLKFNIRQSVIVRAHNSAGWGPASNALSVIPRR